MGVNINISGPLGQQSWPDSGDIPTCVRSLPEPRVDQRRIDFKWQLSTAVLAESLPEASVQGPVANSSWRLLEVGLSRGGPPSKARDPGPPDSWAHRGSTLLHAQQIAKLSILLREHFDT